MANFTPKMSITDFAELLRSTYIWRGGAIRVVGPPGMTKSSVALAIAREFQAQHYDFGACYINGSGYQSVDGMGWPLSGNGLLSANSVPLLFQPNREEGLRGAYPAICPNELVHSDTPSDSIFLPMLNPPIEELRKPYPWGLLIFDEASKVQSEGDMASLSMLAYEARTGMWGVTKKWLRLFISNRQEDNSNDLPFPSTFDNRVATIELTASYDDVASYWSSVCMHPWFMSFAQQFQSLVLSDKVPAGGGAFGTARSWTEAWLDCMTHLERVVNPQVEGGIAEPGHENAETFYPSDEALKEIFDPAQDDPFTQKVGATLINMIAFRCGTTVSGQFADYVAHMNEMPTYSEIVSLPFEAKMPRHPSALHYLIEMLLRSLTLSDLDSIVDYCERNDMPAFIRAIFCTRLLEQFPFVVTKNKRFAKMMRDGGDASRIALTG